MQTRILCVDDDVAVLRSLESVLVYSDFEVDAVSTVPAALELINRKKYDVLLADLNVGEAGDGFTVVSAMRRVQPDACTFILTGYPDIESAIRAIRAQVDNYFAKPLNVPELLSAISETRSGKRIPSRLAAPMKLCEFVRTHRAALCERWLDATLKDPEVAALKLSREERLDHIPTLLEELARAMEDSADFLSEAMTESARKHGRTRFEQGYTIPQVVAEARVLQQVLSSAIQRDLLSIDLSALVPDTFRIGEFVEAALETSVRAYQAQIPRSLQASISLLYKSPHLGVAIANENHIIDANDALLTMIQYTREQMMAGEIDWFEMTPKEIRHRDINAVEQIREYGACVPFEKEFILPDGSRLPFLVGAVRLTSEPLQWAVYIVNLLEQRKLTTVERKVREWESRHAIINHLAHEINNPLAALMFTVHLMGTHSDLSNDMRELVSNAEEMLQRVAAVVKQVLAESQGERGRE
jgi:ActR/RegA family two-component response regulator/signal transduction histidine kinase